MTNSVGPDQTDLGPPCLLLYLNSSGMLGNYLQQTTSADIIFQMNFFLGLKGLLFFTEVTQFTINYSPHRLKVSLIVFLKQKEVAFYVDRSPWVMIDMAESTGSSLEGL